MSEHRHTCNCQHDHVKYCQSCHTVYCVDCHEEWRKPNSFTWAQPYNTTPFYPWQWYPEKVTYSGGTSTGSEITSTSRGVTSLVIDLDNSMTATSPPCTHG